MTEEKPKPQTEEQQKIKAVVLPLDQFERIVDVLREAPHRFAEPVLKEVRGVKVHDINVATPPEQ